jgi:anti-sigma regulatory factor (Ser/Thr protein kinase)
MGGRVECANPFAHEAFLYRNPAEYVAGTVPFVRDGLTAGEPVLVATPPGNGLLLRDALGPDADRVRFTDMARSGRNPGRIIPFVLHAFMAGHPGRRVRIVGESIWPGRTPIEYPACAQHETLINVAFAGRDAAILCPYDAARLDRQWVEDAALTHPVLVTGGRPTASTAYGSPEIVVAWFNQPLPPPPIDATAVVFGLDGLPRVRGAAAKQAAAAGVTGARADDFVLALNELATNSIQHGGGHGTAWLWREARALVAQVHDSGRMVDPMAGRLPPPTESTGGLGLLLVNHVCDLVRMHPGKDGLTVAIYFAVVP